MLPGVGWVGVDLPGLLSAGDFCRCLRHAHSLHTVWPWHMFGGVFLCKQTDTRTYAHTHVHTHTHTTQTFTPVVLRWPRRIGRTRLSPLSRVTHPLVSFPVQGVGQSHSSLKHPHFLGVMEMNGWGGGLSSCGLWLSFLWACPRSPCLDPGHSSEAEV